LAQTNLWTEYMKPKSSRIHDLPRMLALSEVVWELQIQKKYADFQNRMMQHFYWQKKESLQQIDFEITTK
jgi:hypothetical protein